MCKVGQLDKALEYHKRAYQIRKDTFGDQHYETLRSKSMIGECWLRKGENELALQHLQQALEGQEKVEKNPQATTDTLVLIAETYLAQHAFDQALEAAEQALHLRQEAFGRDNPDTAQVYLHLGDINVALKKYADAQKYYQQGKEILERIGMRSHPTMRKFERQMKQLRK